MRDSIGFLFEHPMSVSLINWGVIALETGLFIALFLPQVHKYRFFALAFAFHFSIVLVHGLTSFWLAMSGGLVLYLLRLDVSVAENLRGLKTAWFGEPKPDTASATAPGHIDVEDRRLVTDNQYH